MAHAQNTPEDEYKDLIRVSQDIQPLGEHPFGAQISLYDGGLSFEQTDVSLPGNGLVLQLARDFRIQGAVTKRQYDGVLYAFGDWTLALPRIQTLVGLGSGQTTETHGWEVNAIHPKKRCAEFAKPMSVTMLHGDGAVSPWDPATWWHGYHLIIPGHGNQDLLGNKGADKATYPIVTKQHWRISCIAESTTANGEPGDGFIAHAPDGTRYWFNELVYGSAPSMERPLYSGGITQAGKSSKGSMTTEARHVLAQWLGWLSGSTLAHAAPNQDVLQRKQAWMLVTKIEDRFGNWLKYSYDADGHLTTITAGVAGDSTVRRQLTVQYVSGTDRIHSVTLQPTNAAPRVWTYSYTGSVEFAMRLTAVTLPNGKQWHFDLGAFDDDAGIHAYGGSCLTPAEPTSIDSTWTGTMTHPSGLKGSFTIKPAKHGRSNVPRSCLGMDGHLNQPDYPGTYAAFPAAWYGFTLAQKQFSGAGIPTETWRYDYSPANASWSDQCSGGCASTVWTKVLNPDGSSVRYTFSNRYDYTESQLKKTEFFAGNGTGRIRLVENTYATPTGHAWPSTIGYNLQERINADQTEQRSPLTKRVIHQEGDAYTWQAEAFNAYAQVTKEKRSDDIAGQQTSEIQTTYRNDTTHWVLGLPTQVKNLATGEVEDTYVYNTTTNLLTSRAHFGQTVMHYTWNSAGQLASFTDANSHKTTLSSYKHGIPQTIGYPDGTSQHLTVDDFGQISSITNQAGDKTQYAYDSAGRLTKITYPSGWSPKTFAYAYATSAERGLGAGHWRRTISQGNARHVTYYDALLRPVLTDTSIAGDSDSHLSARTTYNWKGLTTFASWPVVGSPSLSAITAGTTTTYDALGRVTAVSQPSELGTLTTTTTYLSGARKKVTDPAGHATTTSYQVFDTPSYQAVTKVQAPEGIVQTITRNLYGDPTAITQSGSGTASVTKHLYYNAQHRLCRTEEPETGNTLMGYDAAGNLVWSAEGQSVSGSGCGSQPADHTTRSYDAMNRLTAVSYPDGQGDSSTTYDAMGRVHTTQASGTVLWTDAYDTLGHLIKETLAIDGHSWSLRYAYDRNGALSEVTYPDGKRIAYAPDALGRPTKAGIYATGVSYFPGGMLEHYMLADGTDYLAHRNTRHLMDNLTYGTGSVLKISQDYTYDKDANILHMEDLTNSDERTKTLTYDALNRLVSAKAPHLWDNVETYSYDALNNLRRLNDDTYHYANNRLMSITRNGVTVHSFAYDARGDAVQMDSQSRVFSDAHRLLSIPGVASYTYDAAGRRVKTTDADGHKTYYAYNGAGHLMYQWDAVTGQTRDYVYLGKKLVARVDRAEGEAVLNAPGVSIDANPNNGSYNVSWSSIQGVEYTLQEQTNGGSWHAAYSGTTTHKAESGKAGGDYRYRVRACQGDECSDWGLSALVDVTPAKTSVTVPSGYQHGTYTIHWTRPVSTVDVDVQEQFNGGSWKTVASGSKATSLDRPGTTDGSYVYRVRANNASGTRGWSDPSDEVTVLHAPTKAPSLSVPGTSSTVGYTVKWGSVTGATSYTAQVRKNDGSWKALYSGSGRSKKVTSSTNGAHYSYRVKACNAVDCGPWSGTKTVVVAVPPPKPTDVYANSLLVTVHMQTLTVVWEAVSGASSYRIKDVNTGGNVWTGTGTSDVVESGESPLSMHEYAVQSCNPYACSDWVVASLRQVVRKPSQAPDLSAPSGSSSGSYKVSWDEVFGADSYTLEERKNSGSWHVVSRGSARSKSMSGKVDASYSYRVQACNESGCGPWSETRTVSVAKKPAKPTHVRVERFATPKITGYKAYWDAVSGASRYEVKRNDTDRQVYSGPDTSTVLNSVWIPDFPTYYSVSVRACNAVGCSSWVTGG